jgi:flagellar biosynthesis component FlhA
MGDINIKREFEMLQAKLQAEAERHQKAQKSKTLISIVVIGVISVFSTIPCLYYFIQNKMHTKLKSHYSSEYDKLVRQNGQFDTQMNENQMVKEELELCKDDSRVFKMIGDVLVPQTLEEAKSTVSGRIDYIQKEM